MRKSRKKVQRSLLSLWKDASISFFLSFLFISFLFFILFTIQRVTGYGMLPSYTEGQWIIVQRNAKIARFSCVALKIGTGPLQIRRVIGLPGEELVYKQDVLFVKGEEKPEKFLIQEINISQKNGRNYTENMTIKVPKDSYFVLGDNRPYATDSRHYGFVLKKNLRGVVWEGARNIGIEDINV